MNNKVSQTLDAVLDRFKSGDIPQAVSYAMFPIPDLPSSRWSLLNRTIMFISGTCDARGYKQWQQAGRFIKKGSKAVYTQDECVFFHELAHVAHEKVIGHLKPGQDPLQEIVAQLAGQCLCFLVGKSADKFLGTSYRYIEKYAGQIKMTPHKACMKVISDTEKVLQLILGAPEASLNAETSLMATV